MVFEIKLRYSDYRYPKDFNYKRNNVSVFDVFYESFLT